MESTNNSTKENFLNSSEKYFDETFSKKYNSRINIYKKLLLINSFICILIIFFKIIKIHNNIDFILSYVFFSMGIFHVIGIIHGLMYWDDFTKTKNGEANYIKNYYPYIWEKINPYGHIIFRWEFTKYEWGKYIPKNTDPVIDRIRKDKHKRIVYFLPFILILVFIFIGLII